jgi:hypothetical protein
MAWYIGKSQELLKNGGISRLEDVQEFTRAFNAGESTANLWWAINGKGTHTLETIKAVYERLARAEGDQEAMIKALEEFGKKLATGSPYQ